jgi:hypothetical protein
MSAGSRAHGPRTHTPHCLRPCWPPQAPNPPCRALSRVPPTSTPMSALFHLSGCCSPAGHLGWRHQPGWAAVAGLLGRLPPVVRHRLCSRHHPPRAQAAGVSVGPGPRGPHARGRRHHCTGDMGTGRGKGAGARATEEGSGVFGALGWGWRGEGVEAGRQGGREGEGRGGEGQGLGRQWTKVGLWGGGGGERGHRVASCCPCPLCCSREPWFVDSLLTALRVPIPSPPFLHWVLVCGLQVEALDHMSCATGTAFDGTQWGAQDRFKRSPSDASCTTRCGVAVVRQRVFV